MEFDLDSLNDVLDGNTIPENKDDEAKQDEGTDVGAEAGAEGNDGGDPNLESSDEDLSTDEGNVEQNTQAKAQEITNVAFARMRTENAQNIKVLTAIAKALGIQETDPKKLGDQLVNMAQTKLAKDANVPVELYKELNDTKEQLATVQFQQNQIAARERFMDIKDKYGLDDKELLKFAAQLDQEGLNVIENPQIDIEYEYYRRNRESLEKKRIQAAVEEALRNSNMADEKSTKPTNQQGKPKEPGSDAKINNVSALNDLLDGKQ